MEEATKFSDKYIYPSIKEILKDNLMKDYKTTIQEYTQAQYDITPNYKVLSEE